jgi:Ca-activated chloride channel homolog
MDYIYDPYVLLGIKTDATNQDISAAFARLQQRLAAAETKGKPGAIAQMTQIKEAYALLSDQRKRANFDRKHGTQSNTTLFQLKVTPSKKVIEKLQEPQVIYLLADIVPKKTSRTGEGIPPQRMDTGLNLTLVLDHSNSMNGVRLDRVKVAATEIIAQLTPNDILSVVGFNDHAEVVIPATAVEDKKSLATRTRIMRASGGTEMYKGLRAGVQENRKNLRPDRVNHIILLTDGNTYGDQDKCLTLARKLSTEGISVSTLGLGSEWNDEFLDEIASITGGSSGFIKSANAVVSFLNNQVKNLANIFAEQMQLTLAPTADVDVEMTFKLAPSPQPLPEKDAVIQLGGLQVERPMSVLLQLQIPADADVGKLDLGRLVISGRGIAEKHVFTTACDLSVQVSEEPDIEPPPNKILDALGKLTLYRMQERANDSIERGNVREATQRLHNLATRLLEVGQDDLAREAFDEVNRLKTTHALSEEGRKTLKYQTRLLIGEANDGDS